MLGSLHWLSLLWFASLLLLFVSLYYSLIRGFGFIHVVSHLSVLALFSVYVVLFLLDDFTLAVVYYNSHSELEWYYKVAASWSNGGGSLLLFSTIVSLVAILVLLYSGVRASRLACAGFSLVPLSGLLLAFVNGVFYRAEGVVEGLGLNPLLVNPWVYPHPIATFASYALIASSTVLAFSGLLRASRIVASMAWILLTLALMFGALWSYETLGWGGYWAWDPVEVAQLIPWLLLTSAIHSIAISLRLYELLLASTLASVYYSFLVVRAGLSPIHSFASPQAYTAYISVIAIALVMMLALVRARGVTIEVRGLAGYSILASTLLPLYAASTLVGALTPSLLSNLLGLGSLSPPAFDSGVRLYTALLAPATLAALVVLPVPFAPSWFRLPLVILGSLLCLVTPVAILALGYTYAPKSSLYTNMLGVTIAVVAAYTSLTLLTLAIYWFIAGSLANTLRALQHSFLALTLIGIALSAPYSYNQSYFEDTTLKLGAPSGGVELLGLNYEIKGGYIDLQRALEKDPVIARATSSLLMKIARILWFKEMVDEASRELEEWGFKRLLEGVKVEELELETRGGLLRLQNTTLRLELVSLDNETLAILKLEGFKTLNPINLSKPARLELGGNVSLEIYGLDVLNDSVMVIGNLKGRVELGIPAKLANPAFRAYAIYSNDPKARELYELTRDLGLEEPLKSCYLSEVNCVKMLPERIPRVLELHVTLNVAGDARRAILRYDVGGELVGVKGLVPRSVITRIGLSDLYIALYPKVFNVTSTVRVTEAEIAYLSKTYESLDETGRLALTALLVTSRLRSDVGNPRALIEMNPLEYVTATLKLYREASSMEGEMYEVIARVKVVPYMWVTWIALTLAVVTQVILLILHARSRPG